MKTGTFVFVVLILLLILVIGCTKMPPKSEDALGNLTLSLSEFNSFSGQSQLVINGNGSVSYYWAGYENGSKAYIIKLGDITKDELLALVELFKENNFFSMKEQYDCGGCAYVMAPPSFSISFKQGDSEKTVTDIGGYAPGGFDAIVAELYNIMDELIPAELDGFDICYLLEEKIGVYVDDCIKHFINQTNDTDSCKRLEQNDGNLCYGYLAEVTNNASLCSELSFEGDQRDCYTGIALRTNNSGVCGFIQYPNYRDMCYGYVGSETKNATICNMVTVIDERRSDCLAEAYDDPSFCAGQSCFYNFAIETKNITLCDKLPTRQQEGFETSPNIEGCYQQFAVILNDSSLCDIYKNQGLKEVCVAGVEGWKS